MSGNGRAPEDVILPHDDEAERAVLGGMLIDAAACDDAVRLLSREDFHRAPNGELFDAVAAVRRSGAVPDSIVTKFELERRGTLAEVGGTLALAELLRRVPVASNVPFYSARVRTLSIDRLEVEGAQEVAEGTKRGDEARIRRGRAMIARAAARRDEVAGVGDAGVGDSAEDKTAEDWIGSRDRGELPSRPGLIDSGEVRKGDLVGIAGETSAGKSTLATGLVYGLAAGMGHVLDPDGAHPTWNVVASEPCRPLVFQYEDLPADAVARLAALDARSSMLPKLEGRLRLAFPSGERASILHRKGRDFIRSRIDAHKADVVVLDNLQACTPGLNLEDNTFANAFIHETLRPIRDEFGITLIVLVHFNKGGEGKTGPLSRIAGGHVIADALDSCVTLEFDKSGGRVDFSKLLMYHAKARGRARAPTRILSAPDAGGVFHVLDPDVEGRLRAAKAETQTVVLVPIVANVRAELESRRRMMSCDVRELSGMTEDQWKKQWRTLATLCREFAKLVPVARSFAWTWVDPSQENEEDTK